MSIWGSVLSGGVSKLVDAVGNAGDALFTSDEERGQIEIEKQRLGIEEAKLADRAAERQAEINLQEAKHPSVLVAGARPFILWGLGMSMWYHFLIHPIFSPIIEKYLGFALYQIDFQELSMLMAGMLGFGGARTWEKLKGVATSNIERKK